MHGVITRVLDASYNYDIILGRDLLMDVGLVINFKTQVVKWMDHKIPMQDGQFLLDPDHFLATTIDDLNLKIEDGDPVENYIKDDSTSSGRVPKTSLGYRTTILGNCPR